VDYTGGKTTTFIGGRNMTVKLAEGKNELPLSVVWGFKGSYGGVELPELSCGGTIVLTNETAPAPEPEPTPEPVRASMAGVVYDIDAAGEQGPRDDAVHHLAGNAGVAAHDHFQTLPVGMLLLELAGISRREFDDVDGGQRVADGAADGAPDAGNGFDQGHIVNFLRDFL
jgi:hypothetical protein